MAEVKLSEYVTYDDTTGEYTYDWTQLSLDLQYGMDCSSELIFLIYDAFMDDCDNIDLDELANWIRRQNCLVNSADAILQYLYIIIIRFR